MKNYHKCWINCFKHGLNFKELVAVDKKIVVRNHKTGEFLDDFSGSSKDDFSIRKFLGYNSGIMVEINPEKHPKYNIFVEVSRNSAS